MRRGILASDAQRKPAMTLSSCAKAEIDYLLSRIARSDKRAVLEPTLVSTGATVQ
jgi:4-hydroxy-tetrahydrodipicolinate synthase